MERASGKHKHPCLAEPQERIGDKERDAGGRVRCRRSRRAEIRSGLAGAAPTTSSHHLVKPDCRSHRQMLLFIHDNDRPAKQLAASRSFEQLLTSKPSLGSTPAPVLIRRAQNVLCCAVMRLLQRVDISCYHLGKCLSANVFFFFFSFFSRKFMLGDAACGHQME